MLTAWKIHAWLAANPEKRPYKRNLTAFIQRWLARGMGPRNEASCEKEGGREDWKDRLYDMISRNPAYRIMGGNAGAVANPV